MSDKIKTSVSQFTSQSQPDLLSSGCGEEVPQLQHPLRHDGRVAVPEERLRAGRVHQHLRCWRWDWAGLQRRGEEVGQVAQRRNNQIQPVTERPPRNPPRF